MTLVKADVLELARAFRIEVTGAEPIRLVFSRIVEKARELSRPVDLYGVDKNPAVTAWARLALAEAARVASENETEEQHRRDRERSYLQVLTQSAADQRHRAPLGRALVYPFEVVDVGPMDHSLRNTERERAEKWASTEGRRQDTGA